VVVRALATQQVPASAAAGVEGNARLTATTGTLLALLFIVEGFTVLDVRGYITLHTALGLVLIGPVALKCASTLYRFARYYLGQDSYVAKGPPHLVLRVLGPLVILSSSAVLGTGVGLLAAHGRNDTWLPLHKASFIVWFVVMAVHFLAHLREAAVGTVREVGRAAGDPARRGRVLRLAIVTLSLLVGIGVAAAFTPSASSWQLHHHDHGQSQPSH
jgi:hypothetical protein